MPPPRTRYFTTVTLTTVGYVDLHPDGVAGKTFTTFYVFIGFMIFTYVVGAITDMVKEKQAKAMHEARKRKLAQAKTVSRSSLAGSAFSDNAVREMSTPKEIAVKIGYICAPLIGIFVRVAIVEGTTEKWDYIQATYFTAVTATTVGLDAETKVFTDTH